LPVVPRKTYARFLFPPLLALGSLVVSSVDAPAFAQGDAPAGEKAGVEKQREEIYNRVFGRKRAERRLELPIIVGGREIGKTAALVSSDGRHVRVEAEKFTTAMREVLDGSVVERLLSKKDAEGFLGTEALAEEGIRAQIDQRTVSLVLAIEPEKRRLTTIPLRGTAPTVPENLSPSADFSSYVNLRTGIDYNHRAVNGSARGRQPINAGFDSATSIFGTVLESSFTFSEDSERRWQRGDVRLIQDDPENAVRYVAGDLGYPLAGFQNFLPAGGLMVAKNFSLQPYQILQPAGQQEILLRSQSRVDVFVNGRRSQTLDLAPGRYNLRDFPFTQGANDAQLQITDNVGRVTTVDLPFFFASQLLAPGLSQYAYAVGEASRDVGGLRRYGSDTPVFSMLHNYGLTDTMTVGINAQGNGAGQMVGGQVVTATPLGLFSVDVAGNRGLNGMDGALRLGYSDSGGIRADSSFEAVSATVTYTGREFDALSDGPAGGNRIAVDISAAYSRSLFADIVASVGGSYSIGRDGQADAHSESLSFRKPITRYLVASADFGRSTNGTGPPDYRALFRVSLITNEPQQLIEASYDVKPQATRVDWQYSPDYDIRAPAANLSVERRRDSESLTGGVRYNDYRFESSLTHSDVIPSGGRDGVSPQRVTSLRLGTALAFADGHFAVGRPISDSFVIVTPHPNFANRTIGVEPSGQHWRSAVDFLGPALVPSLSSYQFSSVHVVVPDLPVGYDAGQDVFQLQPTYRSGAVLTVGTAATVMLDGTLQREDGTPVSLVAGNAVAVGKPSDKGRQFFTNKRGRFRIDRLNPGRYDLVFPELEGRTVRIEIPEDAEGIYKIGAVRIGGGS
jgi:outer membrane usher protein